MSAVRILWTLPYLPWPITSGGKARQFHLLRSMAQTGCEITLLVQSKTPLDTATREALMPFLHELIVLPRRPLMSVRSLWLAAFSRLPLLASVNGHAPALSARFDALLKQPWDVVQIEHSYGFEPFAATLKTLGPAHRPPVVMVEHNVESTLGAATYGKWPVWARPLARWDQWRAARWERQALSQADVVVAVTDADAAQLARISQRPTACVSNGVDTSAFAAVRPDAHSGRVLFVGNYDYAPNVDAVQWALDELWPRIWAHWPEARFVVCGHALPPAWQARWPDERIEWRGYVKHLPTVQSESALFLAPLRFGGGSKLKVLEALAAGLPVVSTAEGLSGLGLQSGVHAMEAHGAQALADAVLALLQDPVRAASLGQAARAHVGAHFDWQACADQLRHAHAQAMGLSTKERACA